MAKSGGKGIRTLEGLAPLTVFKTVAFVRSAIPPAPSLDPDSNESGCGVIIESPSRTEVKPMAHYLVVANQTLGGEHLIARIRERMAAEPSSFHIVVPATPLPGHATWKEGEATSVAQGRLDRAIARLRELGAEVQGEVGDANP